MDREIDTKKKKVTLANTSTQEAARRIVKKYKNQRIKKAQKRESLLGNIANWEVNMEAKTLFQRRLNAVSKAISSEI